MRWLVPKSLGLLLLAAVLRGGYETQSQLWGRDGELWDPAGRLGDFSFAGYERGERPIPDVPVVLNVRDLGALGNGEHDDTEAFRRAIEQVEQGAILVPAGRYLITDILEIRKPNVVLRGEGPDQTTLYFPRGLEDVRPNMGETTGGQATSNYSWSGGFIWVRGEYRSRVLSDVASPAKRSDRQLTLTTADGLSVGQEIELRQRDDEANSLASYLYAGQAGDISQLTGRTATSFNAFITAIDGSRITLDRPLRTDLDPRWKAQVLHYEPTVTQVGIEGLRFEFPEQPYRGHFTERGHNAIALQAVANCWARDVMIENSDSGIFVSGRNCTLEAIVLRSAREPDRGRNQGHHGITLGGQDNLLAGFRFEARFIHDITVTSGSAGNVAAGGSGVDLALDHHRRAPHANLFTDIDAGAGSRLWRSGGGAGLGRHSASWTTFWNIRTAREQKWPANFGPDLINLVGLRMDQDPVRDLEGRWIEPSGDGIAPANLHRAQLELRQRAQRQGKTSP